LTLNRALRLPNASAQVQANNRCRWNQTRSKAEADFYTIGYSGRQPNELLDALVSVGICSVLDIRYSPVSLHRPEFSKGNLCRLLAQHGIEYQHQPLLGVPRDIRGLAVGAATRDAIWHWYDRNVVAGYIGRNLNHFLNSVDHPVALLCVEADPTACHRHRLCLALERLGLRSFDL